MQGLIESIKFYVSLSTNEITLLKNSIEKRTYGKYENIFTQGKISDRIYFISKGCVRLFYNVDGIDKTAFFYTEGQFICAGES
jgi:CRP-like cAMP-binding protein